MASVEKRPHVPTERMKEFLTQRGGRETEGGGGRLLACPQEGCDKVLTSYPGLRYHIRTHASQPPSYACINCQKQFKSSNGLKYHMERTRCEGSAHSINCLTFQIPPFGGGSQGESDEPSDLSETSDGSHPGSPVKTVLCDKTGLTALHSSTDKCNLNMETNADSKPGEMPASPQGSGEGGEYHDWLRELAIIATSPQSPLMVNQNQENLETNFVHLQGSPPLSPSALPAALHSYARPPRSRTPSPVAKPRVNHMVKSISTFGRRRHASGGGEAYVSSSSPMPSRPRSCSESWDTWSHSWPTAIWQCFIRGTHVKFLVGGKNDWQAVDELAQKEALSAKAALNPEPNSYAVNGLRVTSIEEGESELDPGCVLHLGMSPEILGQTDLFAECAVDHPFFVKDKGWCSVNPGLTVEHYGIPCCELEVGDFCLPPTHPDASFSSTVFESFKSYDFTPMDTSAVFALSSMARQRRDQELSPQISPSTPFRQRSSSKPDIGRAKRPMNAFMLFAKRFRLEYMQLHPGKDNRAISVLLGDQWRRLGIDARRAYTQEARQLAEEHRRAHPDCWKRKRSHSTSCVDAKW